MKMTVHNLMEVKALIKESYARGAEMGFNKVQWNKHTGEPICISHIRDTEFELTLSSEEMVDGYRHLTIEVL